MGMLHKKSLDLADGDGLADARCTALFFAQFSRGAQHAASPPENVIGFDGAHSSRHVAKPQLSDKGCRIGFRGAPFGTGRIMAEQAAVGLGNGLPQVKSLLHAAEIVGVAHRFPPCFPLLCIDLRIDIREGCCSIDIQGNEKLLL
jgi:hypothetical protein